MAQRFSNTSMILSRSAWLARRSTSISGSNCLFNATTKSSSFAKRWLASYPPHQLVGMPSLSPTMESGQIAKWNKVAGEKFIAGDIFCEIQTDKATVDFEAQDDGIVAKLLAPAGSADIKCGDAIMIIVQEEDDVAAFENYVADSAAAPTSEPAPVLVVAVAAAAPVSPSSPQPVAASPGGKTVASPLAFKLAKELGKDITVMQGTGPEGRIVADDVRQYIPMSAAAATTTTTAAAAVVTETTSTAPAAAARQAAPSSPTIGAGYADYPLLPSAMESAARLTQSKRNVPHYYLTIDLKLDSLLKLRSSLNESLTNTTTTQISLNDLLLKAAACAMKAVPEANASWMDTFVRVYDNIDINVVVGGGYTPLIRNVNQKGLVQIGTEFVTLTEKAVDETLTVDECAMGTFTIVNLGSYGIKSAAPIIFEPQACLLALGAAENRIIPKESPTGDDDDVYQQSVMMTATLSCDHRVVDGAVGAQWLNAFKSHVENPNTLLL